MNQALLFMLVTFILTGLFIPLSSDIRIKQLSEKYLVKTIFADQSQSLSIYDGVSTNYKLVSTDQDDKGDTDYICNKLFETCNSIDQTNVTGLESNDKESNEIAKKYFEDSSSTPQQSIPPTTSLNVSEPVSDLQNQTGATQDNLQIYENPTLGVKISYPIGWDKTENQTNRFAVVTFLSPQENSSGTGQEKFLLRINNEPTDMSLDDYTKRVNESVQKNGDFKITSTDSTELANNPASSVTGKLKEGNNELQVLDEWTIKDGIVYRIVFYSEPENADSFQPLVQKILESFSITK